MMAKRWKILLAGTPRAGKSSLSVALMAAPGETPQKPRKTQVPLFHKDMLVDLPGEFLTCPQRHTAFLVMAEDAQAIVYVQSASEPACDIPPGLLQTAPGVRLVGVISKVDRPDADVPRACEALRRLRIPEPYLEVCSKQPASVDALRQQLIDMGIFPHPSGGSSDSGASE